MPVNSDRDNRLNIQLKDSSQEFIYLLVGFWVFLGVRLFCISFGFFWCLFGLVWGFFYLFFF